jgi:hypothetical protein
MNNTKYLEEHILKYGLLSVPEDPCIKYDIGYYYTNSHQFELNFEFDKEIRVGDIPSGTKYVIFNYNYNLPLQKGIFPDSVQVIKFGTKFIQSMTKGIITEGIRAIGFCYAYNQPFENEIFPSSLEKLYLADSYNQPLGIFNLPPNLKTIYFGKAYSYQVLDYPESVNHIIFKREPDSIIINNLPLTIKKLTLYNVNDLTIFENLPCGLEKIILLKKSARDMNLNNIKLPFGCKIYGDNRAIICTDCDFGSDSDYECDSSSDSESELTINTYDNLDDGYESGFL